MFNWIKRLFEKPYIVWADTANWIINNITDFGHYKTYNHCTYEIYFYPQSKRYRLVCSGYKPKKHSFYNEAVKQLNEYYKKLN